MAQTNEDLSVESSTPACRHFGDYLIEKGLISIEERDEALSIQGAINFRLGMLANIEEVISIAQIINVLIEQKKSGKPFGVVARQLKLIDKKELDQLLKRQESLRMKIGEVLVALGCLGKDDLNAALKNFGIESADPGDEGNIR